MSPEVVKLLQAIEEPRLKPYDDHTGKEINNWVLGATIGYGHLIASKEEWPTYKDGITQPQADALFLADAEPKEQAVRETIIVGVQQYEYDAMVILTFNIGGDVNNQSKGFRYSSVAKLINDPNPPKNHLALLETAWKSYNKSRNKEGTLVLNKGLVNRRAAEWCIYTTGVYKRW